MEKQPENEYLARLGLDNDPFSEEVDQNFYYENTELMQRLDMIQHLLGFSNQMIFITGETGMGKTAMMKRLKYYAPDHWSICDIQANSMLNTPILLRQMTSGFGLHPTADTEDMMQVYSDALQSHVESLERSMQLPVVVIDDAHELPLDALILLFGFLQKDSGQAQMKIALFCEPQITTMLESPQLKPLSQNITHQLDIPALNESQTRDYLERRLQCAGLSKEFPLSPETLSNISQQSAGVPARINQLARQALEDDSLVAHSPVVDPIYEIDGPVDDETDAELESLLTFDEPDESSQELTSAPVNPYSSQGENGEPIVKRLQSWQIGAVVVVLALLTGVLWLTSQLSNNNEASIADEVSLDLSPQTTESAEEIAKHFKPASEDDNSIFEESDNIEPSIEEDQSESDPGNMNPSNSQDSDQLVSELEDMIDDEPNSRKPSSETDQQQDVVQSDDPLGEFVQNLQENKNDMVKPNENTSENTEMLAEQTIMDAKTEEAIDAIPDLSQTANDSSQGKPVVKIPEETEPQTDPLALIEPEPATPTTTPGQPVSGETSESIPDSAPEKSQTDPLALVEPEPATPTTTPEQPVSGETGESSPDSAPEKSQTDPLALVEPEPATPTTTPEQPVSGETGESSPDSAPEKSQTDPLALVEPEPATPTTTPEQPVSGETSESSPDSAPEKSQTDPLALVESEPATPTTTPEQPAAPNNGDRNSGVSDVKSENWLRSQDDKLTVLQLMGTHDKAALQKFLRETSLKNEIAWFTTIHNGAPWYVVVKGPYSSRSAALADISALPAETRKRKPWPRSIANIKQAMDQTP